MFFFGRSPWSNKYHPPLEDGPYPSSDLRKLEIEANDVFAVYCDQWGPYLPRLKLFYHPYLLSRWVIISSIQNLKEQ